MGRWNVHAVMLVGLVSLLLASVGCSASKGDSVEEFYKKNTVTLIVPSAAGGGTDYAGRAYAASWTEATGGSIVVKNEAGGGGSEAVNALYDKIKPDGLTLGAAIFAGQMYVKEMLKDPSAKWSTKDFSWIGGFADEPYAFAVGAKSSLKSIEDVKKMKGFKFGGMRLEGHSTLATVLAIEALGLQEPKIIMGLRSGDLSLALARGEIDGYVYVGGEMLGDLRDGHIQKPLFVIDSQKSPFFPDSPALTEVAKLSPALEKQLKAFLTIRGHKVIFAPPGVPEDKLQYLRSSFDKIVALESFKKQALMQWPVWTTPISGKDWDAWIKAAENPQEDAFAMLELGKKYSASK